MNDTKEFFDKVGTQVVSADYGQSGLQPVPQVAPGSSSKGPSEPPIKAHQWSSNDDIFWGATETFRRLPAGCYRTSFSDGVGFHLRRQIVATDGLLVLPDDASTEILAEFEAFWKLETEFAKRGFLHKRGFLLFGPPGSGKTSLIQQMSNKLIAQGDLVLLLDVPFLASGCLRLARQIEPERPIIAILEDFDALVKSHGANEWLALLDGEAQVNRICFVATTNYPEFLDRRFVDRPSRFDTIRRIGMPSAAARRAYLIHKEPSLTADELTKWVRSTGGFSLAHLKEVIIAVKCFEQKFDDVVARLNAMRDAHPSSEDDPDKEPVGMLPLRNGATQTAH